MFKTTETNDQEEFLNDDLNLTELSLLNSSNTINLSEPYPDLNLPKPLIPPFKNIDTFSDTNNDTDLCVTPLKDLKNTDRKKLRVSFNQNIKINKLSPNSSSLDSSESLSFNNFYDDLDSYDNGENIYPEIINIKPKSTNFTKDLTLSSKIDLSEPIDNILLKPELNSTLKLKQKMKKIEQEEVQLCSEVEKKLTNSNIRAIVKDKISLKLTPSQDRYENLLDIDVLDTDVKFLKKRNNIKPREATEGNLLETPRLDQFDKGDIQKESLSLTLHTQPIFEVGLMRIPPSYRFQVYEHSRIYEGLS